MGKLNSEQVLMICLNILTLTVLLYSYWDGQKKLLDSDPGIIHKFKSLKPGWNFTSRYKDFSDLEWSTWKHFLQTSWLHLLIQFLISEIIRNTFPKLIKYWYIISSIIYVFLNSGVKPLLMILIQPLIYSTIIFCGGKKTIIWIASIVIFASVNSLKYKYYFWEFLSYKNSKIEDIYLFMYGLAWVELRCISFSIDYVENKEKMEGSIDNEQIQKSKFDHIINMLSYVLYLPLLYKGPIMLYENFEKSFSAPRGNLFRRIKSFLIDMVIYQIYTFIIDLALHYIYVNAIITDIEILKRLHGIDLFASGLYIVLYFYMKYLVIYGTATTFAKLDNNEPPPPSRCIFRMYIYSYVWRNFDVGLYKFLVKYIYKKAVNAIFQHITRSELGSKLIAALGTYVFIFLWHGTLWNVFIWTTLNYIGILIEYTALRISCTKAYKWFREYVLRTETVEISFISLFGAVILLLIFIGNTYFLGNADIGNLLFEVLMGLVYNCNIFNLSFIYVVTYVIFFLALRLKDLPSRCEVKNVAFKTK